MSTIDQIELQRLRYWQGQMLRSRDFRDQDTMDAQRRWWHNRALHNAFGVGFGLGTSYIHSGGDVAEIRVKQGMAYDCFGRELLLQEVKDIPIPKEYPFHADFAEGEARLTLLIQYREPYQSSCRSDLSAACISGKRSILQEQPVFNWKPARQVTWADGVALAQVIYSSKTEKSFDEQFRPRLARRMTRPRIASGTTVPGGTAWGLRFSRLVVQVPGPVPDLGHIVLEVEIDTSAAGYSLEPCYFASLHLAKPGDSHADFTQEWTEHYHSASLFTHIKDTRSTGFTFVIFLVHSSRAGYYRALTFARQNAFVSWLGVEPEAWTQIMGRVLAGTPSQSRAGALVRLNHPAGETAQQTITDEEGRFIFTGLQEGDYILKAQGPGFPPNSLPIRVPSIAGSYDIRLS